MKRFLRDKKHVMILSISVVICLTVTSFAMTVNDFNDYNPPDYLYIDWADYTKNPMDDPTINNAISNFPRWSAEYPYRAIFLGGTPSKVIEYYVVYSKVPATSLFTFEYSSGAKGTYQLGRIRAKISSFVVGSGKDYRIIRVGHDSTGLYSQISYCPAQRFDVNTSGIGTSSGKYYFSFDFYYDCASEHQQNVYDLSISNVTSISNVPYNYIIHCKEHVGSSGGVNQGGGSGGGGSGGSSGKKPNDGEWGAGNGGGGAGGDQEWGDGEWGGGIDWGNSGAPDINDKDYSYDYPNDYDFETSFPDYWKDPVEDNYNDMPTSEYKPDFPEYIPAEGDTGRTGEDTRLPSFSDDSGVSGTIDGYKEFESSGEYGLIDFMSPMESW